MSYIGREPVIGNFVKLDAISVVNGQASYTMQNGGANFTAYETVNQFLVSLNGILQAPTTSFTVASSTITFASNLVTGDVIDFILVLGNTLDIGTVSDNTISTAKIVDGAITSAKLNSGVALGKVLQVVQTVFTGAKATSSTSLVDVAGASVSITPSSASNKVLVFVHANDSQKGNDSAVSGTMALLRGATQLIQLGGQIGYTGAANYNNVGTVSAMYLDSPSTTSSTTYKLQFSTNSGNTFYINANSNTDSMITAVEIAG